MSNTSSTSSLRFHSYDGTIEVPGSELVRAWRRCVRFATEVFGELDWSDRLMLFPRDSLVNRQAFYHILDHREAGIEEMVTEAVRTALNLADDEKFANGAGIVDTVLNTVLAKTSSEDLRFAALLAGWGRAHLYVERADAADLAQVIEDALVVTKPAWDPAWSGVIPFLCSASTPVVTSYSPESGFPSSRVARKGGAWSPPRCEACRGSGWATAWATAYCDSCDGEGYLLASWDAMSFRERWNLATAGLRGLDVPPRWTPLSHEASTTTPFGAGLTASDLVSALRR